MSTDMRLLHLGTSNTSVCQWCCCAPRLISQNRQHIKVASNTRRVLSVLGRQVKVHSSIHDTNGRRSSEDSCRMRKEGDSRGETSVLLGEKVIAGPALTYLRIRST